MESIKTRLRNVKIMQLAKIKISGFKSFVDPSVIELPSKLAAIVGPNGCGKSNIIDAVTWVMGESSPKYLRGESSTDVIFNGSSARKPVGQALVELIFDNSDAAIAGEYAKFSEISVKRVINRDSDSTYFLNNTRCRKRDVVDLFLGTGLGPRSYSIIGQNMINRIIEAKPDELRTHLEEAAGISKYKDRRHETELRIRHTHENLARVQDVYVELEKQLSHLKHQANIAEKFKTLKEQERMARAQLLGVEWRQIDSQMIEHTLKIQREETALEARNSELSTTDHDIEQLRHEKRVADDAYQETQRRYYSVGNEITRIEQDIVHQQERHHQWESDLKKTELEWKNLQNEIEEIETLLKELEHEIADSEPKLKKIRHEAEILQDQLNKAEEALQSWQNAWDEFNLNAAKTTQSMQVEKTHIQHLEQQVASLKKRQAQLYDQLSQLNFNGVNQELEQLNQETYKVIDQLDYYQNELNHIRKELNTLEGSQKDSNHHLDQIRSELQRLHGLEASLKALQETALGKRDPEAAVWLKKYQLQNQSRLAQHIQVEKGWEAVVEKVLGFCLQAVCVEDYQALIDSVDELQLGNICLFTKKNADQTVTNNHSGTLLLEKIKSDLPLASVLSDIYIADSKEAALSLCQKLKPNESVVTKEGLWLNPSWLKILRDQDPSSGVFEREKELEQLKSRIKQLKLNQNDLEKNIEERQSSIQKLEERLEEMQKHYNYYQAQSAEAKAQQKTKQARLLELKSQSKNLNASQEECVIQLKKAEEQLSHARTAYEKAMAQLNDEKAQRETLLTDRDKAREKYQSVKHIFNEKNRSLHELEIRLQTALSQKSSMHQSLSRLQMQLALLNERKISLQSDLNSIAPLDTLKKTLERALNKHVSAETEMNSARIAVESLEQEFTNLDQRRQTIEREINKYRNSLETLRVTLQGLKVRSDTIIEQIKETEFSIEDILKNLELGLTLNEAKTKLEQVLQRINRLGPINLVAIDEYATCLERKQYLDQQLTDLNDGLKTLEDAIAKIDKETKARFKETFDKVNMRFKELFPTIFGGGEAYLELTSDDLLEAGVSVMACPPGKRNSSIYLLSGGEKSLTALALVFSIFHLNPAPFCLLDEVDAALDDANVLRFARLLKEMSQATQFIYISHNKMSIEMAEHLIGVTMNEPGVSRLVSVDIQKAVTMAGA